MIRRTFLLASSALAAALAAAPVPSVAQGAGFPAKPVTIVVPNAPGGAVDILARLLEKNLGEIWKQPVLVTYKAGAGTVIGTDFVAKSAPDGHTICLVVTSHVINPSLRKNLPFDTLKDLSGVTMLATSPVLISASPEFAAGNVKELIALAKKEPGKLSFASSGAGSSTHMSAELFKSLSGTDLLHIPYKGSGQALPDLMSGRVSMMFENAPGAVSHIKAGKVRALAQTGSKRSASMPDLPTVAESGVPGYESLSWSGIAVPAGTPRAVVDRLNRDFNSVLATAEMRQKLAEQGAETIGGPPEAFAQHIRAEREKWSRLIREKNIVVN